MNTRLVQTATIAVATLLILAPALYNGFPLVYSDTGTYLRSAFTGYVPHDRPYWYGGFIRIASMNGTSLWGVVVVQSCLCAALLWRIWNEFGDTRSWSYLLTVAMLSIFSGLGWYAGQLVPDVLTSIGLLASWHFLFGQGGSMRRTGSVLLILLACWTHVSNLVILPLVSALCVVLAHYSAVRVPRSRVIVLAGVLVAAWPGLWLANKAISGEGHLSRHSHVFLMGRLVDTGILPAWLDEHCPTEDLGICAHRDSLPSTSRAFMWTDRSPLHWQGGADAVRDEYTTIIHASLQQPRYVWMHIVGSLRSTKDQLMQGDIADELEGIYYRQAYSPPYTEVAERLPRHLPAYLAARQNSGTGFLGLSTLSNVHATLMLSSLPLALLLLWRRREPHTRLMIGFALGAVVISAWVCATFSTVDTRYMARTAWMLPFVVALLGSRYHRDRKQRS